MDITMSFQYKENCQYWCVFFGGEFSKDFCELLSILDGYLEILDIRPEYHIGYHKLCYLGWYFDHWISRLWISSRFE